MMRGMSPPAEASREEPRRLPLDGGVLAWWRSAGPGGSRGTVVLIHGLASNASRFAELWIVENARVFAFQFPS